MSVAAQGGRDRADPVLYDLKGLKCPFPVLKTRKRMRLLNSGDSLMVETTDPLAGLDIPHLCQEDGYLLLSQEKTESGHRFVIGKP